MHDRAPSPSPADLPGYLFVLPWDVRYKGGVNQVVANLFREVAHEGVYSPRVLVSSWQDRVPREEIIEGLPVISCRLPAPWIPDRPWLGTVKFLAELPARLATLAGILRRHRVAVVNIHYPTVYMLPFAILKRLGFYRGKLILSLHGTDLKGGVAAHGVEKRYWSALVRSADAIVPCSVALARDACAALPASASRIIAVQNGLDADRLLATKEPDFMLDPRLGGERFLLNIAQFVPKKAHEILLPAFHEVSRRYPDLKLVLVGGQGPTKEAVLGLIRELGLESRIFVYEDISHARVCEFLRRALLLVLPSHGDEGLPLALLEAGAMNLPVIASCVGGIPEVIVDGETGLLIPPGDVQELTKKLEVLIGDQELRRRLAAGLNRRVLEHFTWRRAYHEYRGIIA